MNRIGELILLGLTCLCLSPQVAAQVPGLTGAAVEEPVEQAAPIELKSPDSEIAERLRGLFGDIVGLENVQPEVRGGVVVLRGATLTAAEGKKAEEIAGRLAGVVSVENELVTEHRVGRRLQPLIDRGQEFFTSALNFAPLLFVALVTFVAFWMSGRVLTRSTRLFSRLAPNAFIESLVEQAVRLVFILVGLLAAMSIVGATALLSSLLGAAGLFGLAVGFAVRDTIENYIASILLSVRQPFSPNDLVLIGDFEGRVTRLNSRATLLTTLDGNEVRIPNATVYKAVITNFTRLPERRFEFEVGVGYENELARAQAIAISAAKAASGVLADPAPSALIHRLDAYAVTILVFGWIDQSTSDILKVRSETIRRVKAAFDESGVSMPEPIQNVRSLSDTTAASEAETGGAPPQLDRVVRGDTTADDTIKEKVHKIRATGEEDLLSSHAPRE